MKIGEKNIALPNIEELVAHLVHSNYAFAAWRLPNSAESHFIISLDRPRPATCAVEQLSSGFIINGYQQNHPPKPYHLSADIIIKNEEVIIDPKISDQQLDEFNERINENIQRIKQEAPIKDDLNLPRADDRYKKLVEEAIEEIKMGTFEKIVLSRYSDVPLPQDFSIWRFYKSLNQQYPNAFCSLTFIPEKGIWVGATPELFISTDQHSFKTVALAGTKKLAAGLDLSEIAWAQKEIEEQALVSRYIINCFKKIRLREFHEHGPKTIKAGNLAHLKTTFEVKYDEVPFDGMTDQLIELLHPTSAVCGMPINQADPWIKKKEGYDREFYAGFLGPVNFENATQLFVNLRCAKITHEKIRFYAGAGIIEESKPEKELEETTMKMEILKSMLNDQH